MQKKQSNFTPAHNALNFHAFCLRVLKQTLTCHVSLHYLLIFAIKKLAHVTHAPCTFKFTHIPFFHIFAFYIFILLLKLG